MPGIRHLQLRVNGLIGTNQTWSVNPKFVVPGNPPAVPTQAVMDAWATAVAALNGGDVIPDYTLLSVAASVTGVTASYINEDNQTVVVAERVLDTPAVGVGAPSFPGQCAVVTSLITNIPGRRTRGRLYWPFLALGIDSETLRLTPSDAQAIATVTGTWLHDVAAAFGSTGPLIPSVVSLAGGTSAPIVSVRVGDVVDTQRRRRDQLLENYVSAPVA